MFQLIFYPFYVKLRTSRNQLDFCIWFTYGSDLSCRWICKGEINDKYRVPWRTSPFVKTNQSEWIRQEQNWLLFPPFNFSLLLIRLLFSDFHLCSERCCSCHCLSCFCDCDLQQKTELWPFRLEIAQYFHRNSCLGWVLFLTFRHLWACRLLVSKRYIRPLLCYWKVLLCCWSYEHRWRRFEFVILAFI